MTIAISGASGNLGRLTAEFLLDQVEPSSVVLLTRSPDKLADLAARGAVVRAADFGDPAGLTDALAGVDTFLLVSTDAVGVRLDQQEAAINAAKDAGVGHVVYTSAPKPTTDNPAIAVADHHATEEALKASGLTWTFLRNNLYSEFQVAEGAPAVASGQLFTNAPDGAVAWVTRVDLARVAAAVLADATGHENTAYELGGVEALTRRDFAALLTEVTGRPVEVVPVDDAALEAGLVAAGIPAVVAPVLSTFGIAAREGYLDGASDIVERLTGTPATPLREVLLAAKDELVGVPA
ncbi:MAG: NAD(P)-dependent oxidoreductase [Marmoricola sp.]|nr:NAD(P)-dependent oxidoreductase [Marmoricola sp.]